VVHMDNGSAAITCSTRRRVVRVASMCILSTFTHQFARLYILPLASVVFHWTEIINEAGTGIQEGTVAIASWYHCPG